MKYGKAAVLTAYRTQVLNLTESVFCFHNDGFSFTIYDL